MNIIVEDYRSYRRAFMQQGFWATLIHRYGTFARSTRPALVRVPLRVVHFALIKFSEIFYGIYIGPNVTLGRRVVIEHFGNIIIHSDAVIGDDVRLRHEVTIGNKGAQDAVGAPVLGNRVDVGAGAKILGRIHIGDGAVIGANAVVITDVPPGAMAVGVPAKIRMPKAPAALS